VLKHHKDAVGMENVPAGHFHTRFFAKLTREADATKFALCSVLQDDMSRAGIRVGVVRLLVDGGLDAFWL